MGKANGKKVFTDKDLHQLEGFSSLRIPMGQIATLLGVSQDTLERHYKKNGDVRAVIDRGRAKASLAVRNTLYFMAVGRAVKNVEDKDGNIHVIKSTQPDFQALKFWCQTQEGFNTRIELTGADGAPLNAGSDISDEELENRTQKALARIAARKYVTQHNED